MAESSILELVEILNGVVIVTAFREIVDASHGSQLPPARQAFPITERLRI